MMIYPTKDKDIIAAVVCRLFDVIMILPAGLRISSSNLHTKFLFISWCDFNDELNWLANIT